jgi:hypothetical protein
MLPAVELQRPLFLDQDLGYLFTAAGICAVLSISFEDVHMHWRWPMLTMPDDDAGKIHNWI